MNEIKEIYKQTSAKFLEWSQSPNGDKRNAACPETLRANPDYSVIGDPMGFSILWTSPKVDAEILFCGCCVTSFGDRNTNQSNLAGEIPTHNTCINSQHKFGQTIEDVFKSVGQMALFKSCVGMNLWHFQYVGSPFPNQYHSEVRQFCEANTVKIIQLLRPKRVITLHNYAARKLKADFPNLISMPHPSYRSGVPFREDMTNFLREEF